MMISEIRKGRSTTTVVVTGFAADRPVSDDLVIGFAMHAARENPSSLFGWHIHHNGETATVSLNTD